MPQRALPVEPKLGEEGVVLLTILDQALLIRRVHTMRRVREWGRVSLISLEHLKNRRQHNQQTVRGHGLYPQKVVVLKRPYTVYKPHYIPHLYFVHQVMVGVAATYLLSTKRTLLLDSGPIRLPCMLYMLRATAVTLYGSSVF